MARTLEIFIFIFYFYMTFNRNNLDKNALLHEEHYVEDGNWIIECATYYKPDFGKEKLYNLVLSPTHFRPEETVTSSRRKINSCSYLSTIVLLLSGDVSINPGPTSTDDSHLNHCFQKKGLHLLHLNVRSLLNKVDEVHALTESSNAAVLCVSETWLDSTISDAEVNIPGYVLERKDRRRDGGGVCIYIRDNLVFNRRSELESDNLEFLAIDILLPKTKPILIGACYRPPKSNDFYKKLEDQLSNSPHFVHQETYLLGDFNTDVSSKKNNCLVKLLNGFLRMFSFTQLIECHTRVTVSTASILDLIIVSDVDRVTQSGVLKCSFSDHDVIYCTRKLNRGHFTKDNVAKIRCMKNYNKEDFVSRVQLLDWNSVLDMKDVNEAWCSFSNMFKNVIEEVAPLKEVRLKQRNQLWFNGEVREMIRLRNQAHLKFRQTKNNDDYLEFKRIRNLTQRKIQSYKRNYVLNQLEENQSCSKKLWCNLKQLGMPTKSKSGRSSIGLKVDNSNDIVFDNKTVADKFNRFFCSIAAKLVEKLEKRPFDEDKITEFYKGKGVSPNAFILADVPVDKVQKQLSSLNITKSVGCDGISARFLKEAAEVIAIPLTHIINLSLKTGKVPRDFKTARVVPLYKKGDCNYEGNYRPVSILPIVSKVFERIVHDQLYQYLSSNSLVYDFQSGFRSKYSTDTALTYLGDKLRFNMDKGLYTGVILLDLQKAFDTVDHSILVSKLRAIGADNIAVKWFSSYLDERKQFVDVQGTFSSQEDVSCGVPQGSILGPLLFTLYVNDMSTAVNCDLSLYADDSMLLISGENVNHVEEALEQEMNEISKWLQANKLSLHLGKTESILFGSVHKLKKVSKMKISCNNVEIEAKSSVKYLGVVLDQDMTGSTMGNNVVKKINSVLKFLHRKSSFLKFSNRKLLCSALLQSRFDYGYNFFYRGMYCDIKLKFQTAQNKMIRFILEYNSRQHLYVKDFVRAGYLSVEKRYDYLSVNLMYNIYYGQAPSYLCQFKKVDTVHSYGTRGSVMSYVLPNIKTQGKKTFMYNGAKLWNSLPVSMKTIECKDNFKKKCKKYFFSLMEKSENSQVTQ